MIMIKVVMFYRVEELGAQKMHACNVSEDPRAGSYAVKNSF